MNYYMKYLFFFFNLGYTILISYFDNLIDKGGTSKMLRDVFAFPPFTNYNHLGKLKLWFKGTFQKSKSNGRVHQKM